MEEAKLFAGNDFSFQQTSSNLPLVANMTCLFVLSLMVHLIHFPKAIFFLIFLFVFFVFFCIFSGYVNLTYKMSSGWAYWIMFYYYWFGK